MRGLLHPKVRNPTIEATPDTTSVISHVILAFQRSYIPTTRIASTVFPPLLSKERTPKDTSRPETLSQLRSQSQHRTYPPSQIHPPNPSNTPQTLFPPGIGYNTHPIVSRFIRRTDPTQILLYTDGAYLKNSRSHPQADHGIIFRPSKDLPPDPKLENNSNFRLENEGPTDEEYPTSTRAGWITGRDRGVSRGRRLGLRDGSSGAGRRARGMPVKNRDLWECLLGEMERWDDAGLRIQFWRIPRDWNTDADLYAKQGALKTPRSEFADISGVLV
ncbi:uncharacterized protein BO80DRAFT_441919 [Aspergillus ibericus CBS 121593]|uniref:RNase H type-1 domain-containing protein n=1 Tax=Aspergillus ibericus CBS 121593 TaxID=1448316 RepID=A0A395HAD8_9EURO|nr:hypothetical protein BO80DRAFT_441919 [Aspergillus ibericus CBS 121593]RAL04453.1 hypothetical protein BO80DRAFT_441919 [Aspergillus ibericus CBS 121593]